MSNTHLRKVIRDIVARKTRTFLVSVSVFIGVLGVVVLTTTGELITRQLEKDLIPGEMSMLQIYLDLPDDADPVDNEALLATLANQPGVTNVEGQAVYNISWKLPDHDGLHEGNIYA